MIHKATRKEFTLVIPFDSGILKKLNGQPFIVRTDTINISEIKELIKKINKKAKSILIDYRDQSLNFVHIDENWKDIETTLLISEIGSVKKLIANADLLKMLDLKIFLPASKEKSFTDTRILASLGIHSGIFIDDIEKVLWEEFLDLSKYYFKSRVKLAPIEPFSFIKFHYKPNEELDYNNIYANNPEHFLHLNLNEEIALNYEDFNNHKFIARGIDEISKIEANPDFLEINQKKEKIFSQLSDCSVCPGWKICLGKFNNIENKKETCSRSFTQMINFLEHREVKKAVIKVKKT